jgi:hypothetical protein
MINSIEKALSNRSGCTKCRQTIEVGSLRGVQIGTAFGHDAKSYFCTKCTKTLLEEQLAFTQKLLDLVS